MNKLNYKNFKQSPNIRQEDILTFVRKYQ